MIRIVHMSLFLGLMVIFVMTLSGCSHSGTSGGSAPGGPPVGSSPSGDWTWVSGGNLINQTGVYTAPSGNVPGGRSGSVSWIDASGNFWLFGGYGIDSTGSGGWLNDLWKFDGANWTWVSGSNLINQAGVYSAPSGNVPGGRSGAVSWIDASGNFWLFGGYGIDSTGNLGGSLLNDLWKFDGANWTWVSGSNTGDQAGVYSKAPSGNVPGARYGAVSWIDASGNFWLFGGNGLDSTGSLDPSGMNALNDLWKFDGDQLDLGIGQQPYKSGRRIRRAPSGNVPGGRSALFPGSMRAATSGSSAGMASIRPEAWALPTIFSSMTSGNSTGRTGPGCPAAIPAIRQAYTAIRAPPIPGTSQGD